MHSLERHSRGAGTLEELLSGLPTQLAPERFSSMGEGTNRRLYEDFDRDSGHFSRQDPNVRTICEHPAVVRGIPYRDLLAQLGIEFDKADQYILDHILKRDGADLPVKVRDLSPLLDALNRALLAFSSELGFDPKSGIRATSDGYTYTLKQEAPDEFARRAEIDLRLDPTTIEGGWTYTIMGGGGVSGHVPSPVEYLGMKRALLGKTEQVDNFSGLARYDVRVVKAFLEASRVVDAIRASTPSPAPLQRPALL